MENQRGSSEGEDIPSDFFDDFNKEEFMEGLSVIDSWDDEDKKAHGSRARINLAVDNVRDLRELIVRQEDETRDDRLRWRPNKSPSHNKQSSRQRLDSDHLDDYIKPGSRRDPNKTNEAIRRDKEVKVKEYLAKHLGSGSDLCPPGTELEDFFEDHKAVEARKRLSVNKSGVFSPAREHRQKHMRYSGDSPMRRRETPPRYRRAHGSPRRPHHSPHRRPSVRYHSPHKSIRKYNRYSPRRVSPEFRRDRRSRSPYKRFRHQSRSHSPVRRHERWREERHRSRSSNYKSERDDFLYPKDYLPPPEYSSVKTEIPYQVEPEPQYANPVPVEYGNAPNYSYTQVQGYSGYGIPYEYGTQPTPPMVLPVPQPVPAPNISSTSSDPSIFNPTQPPPIIPSQHIAVPAITNQSTLQNAPETMQSAQIDALAKLVAEGKLSHEDYLKLAPSKGLCQAMDTHTRVAVLNRCHVAMSRLGNIMVPNQLLINNSLIGSEQKQLAPKFCSPLKRQAAMDFHFTKYDSSAVSRQNKLIVDSIIATLDIEKVVGKPKKIQKDTKDAAVQTTKPFCEVCEIRESKKFTNAETSIDREQFSSTVHTQVVEQDLVSSKSMFNPTGGKVEGANISIAHMTPAQLVSQLAARAKTLKQTEPAHSSSQFHHTQGFDYDDRRSDKQYRNHYNYRY
ncbi:uncharacterized protein LOC126769458 [Nymphalis io]|uniref:uncharacterized protein LOC126769458 n=1 Tax=Inachis io TaxID=171585 RepID=UPI00216A3885|nr:uncharacterized protein LOC126769458 [Nymphalis io]